MNQETVLSFISVMLIIVFVMAGIVLLNTNSIGIESRGMQQDLNVLKNNDLAIANYVQANSQAIAFLQTCKIVEDTNYTQTILCTKDMKQ